MKVLYFSLVGMILTACAYKPPPRVYSAYSCSKYDCLFLMNFSTEIECEVFIEGLARLYKNNREVPTKLLVCKEKLK